MSNLRPVLSVEDIFSQYRNTPVEKLIRFHNFQETLVPCNKAELLIAMCMDNRKMLRTPDNFAYILRTGGGSLRHNEFKVSYSIGIGGISAIALIAHNHCGMVNLDERKTQFINGLVEKAGWDKGRAEEHFDHFAPVFEIGDEIDFVLSEAKRLRLRYPKITIAPLYYKLEDNRLYLIEE